MTDEIRCHLCLRAEPKIGFVCVPCANRVRRDLSTIQRAWIVTEAGPLAQNRGATGAERPLPGGVEWLDWRHGGELVGVLSSWARVWHEDSAVPLTWPTLTVESLLSWMRAHIEAHGFTHEAIGEYAAEIGAWSRRAAHMAGQTPPGEVVLCPGLAEPCGRRLRVDIARPEIKVLCRGCDTEWTSARLLLHGVTGGADAWVDPGTIRDALGIPERTLRHWAAQGKVSRQGGRYLLREVYEARL